MGRFINDKKDYFTLFCWGYFLVLLVFSVIGDRGLLTSLSLWGQKMQLIDDISQLKQEIQIAESEVIEFRKNDRIIYQYAREKMNMQQESEIQYIFKNAK